MATIKACPCCGQPAKLLENHYGTIAEYWVICPECRLGTTWHPSKAEAIAAWNTRAGCASCRDEAIGAALAVEQKCYDHAQEIKALRALREALDSALEVVEGEWVRDLQVNPPKWRAVMDALIVSKQASAPTGDEHK